MVVLLFPLHQNQLVLCVLVAFSPLPVYVVGYIFRSRPKRAGSTSSGIWVWLTRLPGPAGQHGAQLRRLDVLPTRGKKPRTASIRIVCHPSLTLSRSKIGLLVVILCKGEERAHIYSAQIPTDTDTQTQTHKGQSERMEEAESERLSKKLSVVWCFSIGFVHQF